MEQEISVYGHYGRQIVAKFKNAENSSQNQQLDTLFNTIILSINTVYLSTSTTLFLIQQIFLDINYLYLSTSTTLF